MLPSVNVPVAANCSVVPSEIKELTGEMATETRVAAVTVSAVPPLIVPEVALMVAVPTPAPVASPCVPGALLTVATAVDEELH